MRTEIESIKELIDLLGGTAEVARWASMSQSAICNWIDRRHIPASWHVELAVEVRKRGLPPVSPQVFGLDGEAADFFRQSYSAQDEKSRPKPTSAEAAA